MNLEKLFKMQKVLSNKILENHPELKGQDLFNKKVLALLVELGECANEYRAWKFWSKNQQPRTKASRNAAMMEEDKEYYNPLLEEYVDSLHFLLELGLELGVTEFDEWVFPTVFGQEDVTQAFLDVNGCLDAFRNFRDWETYSDLFKEHLWLGACLGFEWEQVEKAYLAKNEINHARQDSGTY